MVCFTRVPLGPLYILTRYRLLDTGNHRRQRLQQRCCPRRARRGFVRSEWVTDPDTVLCARYEPRSKGTLF